MSTIRAALARIPAIAWLCGLAGFVNVAAWTFVTPPMHVPDENVHFAYAQYLAETGKPPSKPSGPLSEEEETVVDAGLDFYGVLGRPNAKPIWTAREDARLRAVERRNLSRVGSGTALSSTNNPPLYYLLQSTAYWVSPSHDLLDRLALMRLLSALLAGVTALLCALFVRELVPASPWAWAAGGLAVAFQPQFGFISGGVTNDALLYPLSAGILWALARILHRGLTVRRGVVLGAFVGAATITKFTVAGLLPAVALGVLLALWRVPRERRGEGLRAAGAALGVALAPLAVYVVALQTVWTRGVVNTSAFAEAGATAPGGGSNLGEMLTYVWQLYLVRLPFMDDQFFGTPFDDLWFKGFMGRFGWVEFSFPDWVYVVALVAVIPVLALGVAGLARNLGALRRRWPELGVYAIAAVGLLVFIGVLGYRYREANGSQFEQARYLLPLLALYAGLIGVAVRAGGRRAGPVLAVAVVTLAAAHSLFAQLLVLARFYG